MGIPQKEYGPQFHDFARNDPKFNDFMVHSIDYVDLQLKMQAIRNGTPGAKDLVSNEVEKMIVDTKRRLSETYTLVVPALTSLPRKGPNPNPNVSRPPPTLCHPAGSDSTPRFATIR